MESLFIEKAEFWSWFNRRDKSNDETAIDFGATKIQPNKPAGQTLKRIRTDLNVPGSIRYRILWGRHKAGKKHKVWEDDGFLTLIGRIAHVVDEKGRLLEEPTLIDEIDCKELEDSGEIVIGSTQIQVQEKDE